MSGDKTALPLLKTKLHKPPVVTGHLHRQHLLDRLNRYRQRPLTLVSAPAGYEAIREIRQCSGGETIPICAVTASAFREQRPGILAAGCDEVVYKPFQEHEIFEVMGRFLDIAYVYEQEHQAAPEQLSQTELTAMLADIPDALLRELEAATLALDREAALDIISRIAEKAPDLAAGLKGFVDNFQMAELRTLLEIK